MVRLLLLSLLCSVFVPLVLPAQCLKGDCTEGYGELRLPDGTVYKGWFKNGKMHGSGICYYRRGDVYLGWFVEGLREGEGRLKFAEGHDFLGQWRADRRNGFGRMKWADGSRYEGNWKDDLPHGKGKYFFADGGWYEGQFVRGQFEGFGIRQYADGTRYEGQWHQGKKHGEGKWVAADGSAWTGKWIEGRRIDAHAPVTESAKSPLRDCNNEYCAEGMGRYVFADGSVYVGAFKNGLPGGQGEVWYANGDHYKGGWYRTLPDGLGTMTFADGRILTAEWDLGQTTRIIATRDAPYPRLEVEPLRDPEARTWAVIVGISTYSHQPALHYTDNDAFRLYSFLKSPEGGALPDEQVALLIDEEATREHVLRALQEVLLRADDNDVVLFYFSGHGIEGAFLPTDYDGSFHKLAHEEILEILQRSQARLKLVLGDACHSGSLQHAKAPTRLSELYGQLTPDQGGIALMLSSRSEEISLEDSNLRSGVFSYFLIQALKGLADRNADGIVTLEETFQYVHREVRRYTAGVQTPVLTGTADTTVPVAVVRKW